MLRFFACWSVALGVMLMLDAVWLGVMGSRLYRPMLGDLLAPDFRLAPAAVFYMIYAAGVAALAVCSDEGVRPWRQAAIYGAILGFCAYATYDLTNQATLRRWPTLLTAIDMAWGTLLTAVVAAVSARINLGR